MKLFINPKTQILLALSIIYLGAISCSQKEVKPEYNRIMNSRPLGNTRIDLIVQDQVSGVNRFDTSNNANWTIEQIKIEQILASGELSAPVQMPEVITTGKGKMLVLITSRSYAFDEGFSKIKVSWPDNTSDIFKIHFEDAEIDNRITTIDMNEEPIWPAKNDTRTYSIINK